jgi:hypothetical protein
MPSLGRELSAPRTWFVTVRLLEGCVAALLLVAALEIWTVYESSSQSAYRADGSMVTNPSLMQRITAFVLFGGVFRSPIALMMAVLVLLACIAVLHRVKPVSNAGVLRWELLVGLGLTMVLLLPLLVTPIVALFGDNPFQSNDPSVISGYQGPGLIEQVIAATAWPVAVLAVLAVGGLWWIRLPAEFEEPAEEEAARQAKAERAERARTMRRPVPTADVDDIVLEGVEYIEPVERLEPRVVRGDGSTTSGYDDYFKRF